MKRYRFRFGSVLRLRQVEEEQARAGMLEAERLAEEATRHLAQRLNAVGAALATPTSRTSRAFQGERDQLQRHMNAIKAARTAEANALASFSASRQDWEEAAQRVRALEKLNDRQREMWVLETTRAAQQITDEIAGIHHRGGPDPVHFRSDEP